MEASMSMGVLDKARELADAISSCNELATLKQAAEKIDGDDTSAGMLREYQEKQAVARQASNAGLELPPEHAQEIQGLQQRIDNNQHIQEFAKAQGSFYSLIDQVNDIIAQAVMGKSAPEPQEPEVGGEGHVHGPGCSH